MRENDKNKKKMNEVMEKPRQIVQMMASEKSDPNGSYTGVPKNKKEKPVQDADDL